ncbi:ABC transporter ATP-binding protein [Chitinimonas koreensis]|uniref:ABC transporter ATP-binding protein n=1 Tax=Chitinimonas koreensis TaxID=356302 RepID=UPI0004019380|nr:dipeptide ABC transporter ATP-binding protein [Chitinimonas koreensis]QNM94937.1 ABC transporter ATP-binding protein [Chitinimonas koreensis]
MSQNNLLEVKDLRVSFRMGKGERFDALKGVNYVIPAHSTVALVGESGSGKSVSAMAIMGLLPKSNTEFGAQSQILFEGRDLLRESDAANRKRCGKEISMIFQDPMTSLNPVYRVGEQIVEVLKLHKDIGKKAARARAIELLREVGIPDPEKRIDSYPHEMSGGQQQRVMIAMAIACEPKLLIADEPTTALDVTVQKQIVELLKKLQQQHGMSILFITHDLELVRETADHVVVMHHGVIKEQGASKDVFAAPADPYTRALLACRPSIDKRPIRLPVVDDFLSGREHELPRGERQRGVNPADPIVLEVKNLRKSFSVKQGLFGRREVDAVKGVSFKLARGKTVGIVGESGSGKTTLGKTILRLHSCQGGEVSFDGRDLMALSDKEFQPYKRRMQIIFQNPYASLNPRFTVGDILLEPMRVHRIHDNDRDRREHALQLLKRVGLDERAFHKYPHEFSGGQRQRISIARCLSMKPEILVCDESVSALDVSVQAQVLNLLQELQDEYGMSYLFISHDLNVVKYISDEVLVMNHGEMVEYANADELYRDPKHPYTQKLLAAIPGRN